MPTINISKEELTDVKVLIDELHDYFEKYSDVVDATDGSRVSVANDEMIFLNRLKTLDYIFNENIEEYHDI